MVSPAFTSTSLHILIKALGSGSYQLKDVVIQNTGSREKETALLLDQKNAVEMKQSIGAQELSRKGISDAAAAVIKTSGVSKQEGVKKCFRAWAWRPLQLNNPERIAASFGRPRLQDIALDFFIRTSSKYWCQQNVQFYLIW